MNDTAKIAIVLASLVAGATPTLAAAPHHHYHHTRAPSDPWVEPIHLDSTAVPAKQFFEELQRDGD